VTNSKAKNTTCCLFQFHFDDLLMEEADQSKKLSNDRHNEKREDSEIS
jgi:hypothetical protein